MPPRLKLARSLTTFLPPSRAPPPLFVCSLGTARAGISGFACGRVSVVAGTDMHTCVRVSHTYYHSHGSARRHSRCDLRRCRKIAGTFCSISKVAEHACCQRGSYGILIQHLDACYLLISAPSVSTCHLPPSHCILL